MITVEFQNESIASEQIKDICENLQKDEVKAISLRECTLTDKDYKRVLKSVAASKNLRHLSLNIGIIQDTFRIQVLALALQKNRSLTGLFIHGNEIGDAGLKILQPSLMNHPHILSLDVGDCGVGDEGLDVLCRLLVRTHDRPGLEELVLSSNPEITAKGWAKLGVAMAAGCNLSSLYVDYNELGDSSASCLLVAMAGTKSLETLDMECVGATETTGQVLLHLVKNYTVSLKHINLDENEISETTQEAIRLHIPGVVEDDLSNAIHSDDERSLATSEPPLDPQSDLREFISPVNGITIVGATDSPIYTPDVITTDRSPSEELETPDSTNMLVPNEPQGSTETKNDGLLGETKDTNETKIREVAFADNNEALDTETYDVITGERKSPSKSEFTKEDLGANEEKVKPVSLADRIKLQRDKQSESSKMIVGPADEVTEEVIVPLNQNNQNKTNENTENGSLFLVRPKETTERHTEHQEQSIKVIPKAESVEQVEDIEDMDEAAINSAHANLNIPGTPSKMSLADGPGVKSTTSIFDDSKLLRISPSNNINMRRRYSHNIEIKEEENKNLQGIAKHRGSEGNIAARLVNRRESIPNNSRLMVHGVGSSTSINELQAGDTRRRLSNASTLDLFQ